MDKRMVKLMKEGFSFKTLNSMSDKSLKLLFEKMTKKENKESVTMVKGSNKPEIENLKRQGVTFQVYEADEEDSMNFEKGERTQSPKQVGPATDDGFDDYGDGMPTENEMKEGKKKSKINPFAICTSSLGKIFGSTERSDWTKTQMNHYERCVMALKKGVKKREDVKESLVESLIFALVEKHVKPSTNKKDFMTYISEQNPGTKEKEKEREKTKTPGKPKDDPNDPYSPKPGIKTRPKAAEPGTKEREKEREKTKTPGRPKDNPNDPFSPKPGVKPRPKAAEPGTKEREKEREKTKTPGKPKDDPNDPYSPKPGIKTRPKAGKNQPELPDFLSYENIFKNKK
jgi:hypothetical protein